MANNAEVANTRMFKVTLGVVVSGMALSVFFAWPDNVLLTTSSSPLRTAFGATFGQGWAFFTNPPQDPVTRVYRAGDGADLLATPQGNAENAFGISRNQRAQGPELAILSNAASEWHECRSESWQKCHTEANRLPAEALDPPIRKQSVCGELVLSVENPKPWAFRSSGKPYFSVKHYAKVVVPCRS